jgi:alkylation response protein AidB-like acyl-CoA dehydrogenase
VNDRLEAVWSRVRAMQPVIAANRAEAERLRRLPDPIARAFVEENLHRVLLPEDLGGEGISPIDQFDLAEALAFYDGSVSWNFSVSSVVPAILGGLPVSRLKEIFASADCGHAGALMPSGRATLAPGGYRLNGRWPWGSGVHQAKWLIASSIVFDGDKPRLGPNGMPQTMQFVVPASAARIHDTWHTGGLRGTGSTDWELSDCFVSQVDSFQAFGGKSEHPAPIFRLPATFFGLALTAVPLGVARASLAGLKELAARKISATTRVAMKDMSSAQYAIAKAEALLESSRMNVREAFRSVWERVVAGAPVALDQRARVRRAYVQAGEAAQEAVTLCFKAAGGNTVFQSAPFEQALRDVFAATAHITFHRQTMELAGQAELGMPIASPIF